MAKLSNKNASTSFHFTTIRTTVNKLTSALGEAQSIDNSGDDKVNFDWNCETEDGDVFTIYDWKEYRMIDVNEKIEWHIGANSRMVSFDAQDEITRELSN